MKKSLYFITKQMHNNKIKSFYYSKVYEGQSTVSRIINYYLNRLLVFVVALLLFIYFTEGQRFYAVIAASFSLLLIFHLIMKHLEEKKLKEVTKEVNEKIARDIFLKKLKSLDQDAFVNFIQEILEQLPYFSDIQVTNFLENEGINLLCKYKGELTAIQCHLLDEENAVEARRARQLSRTMSKRGYKKAIIISTSDFREDTRLFCELIKEKRQISLLAKEEFIQMAKDAGKFPEEADIRNFILKKLEHRERIWQKSTKKILSKRRIYTYLVYGTILLTIGFLLKDTFQMVYFLCGFFLYGISVLGIFFNLNRKNSLNSNWQDVLD